jgi:hypothetical protein
VKSRRPERGPRRPSRDLAPPRPCGPAPSPLLVAFVRSLVDGPRPTPRGLGEPAFVRCWATRETRVDNSLPYERVLATGRMVITDEGREYVARLDRGLAP